MPQKQPYCDPTDSNSLLYLRARYYHPAQGVFTTRDPFGGAGDRSMSLNGYSWIEGNVPNSMSPSLARLFGRHENTIRRWEKTRLAGVVSKRASVLRCRKVGAHRHDRTVLTKEE